MLGPVMMEIRFFPLSRYVSLATNRSSAHHLLHHRMAAVLDMDDALFVDLRLHIVVPRRPPADREANTSSSGNGLGSALDPHDLSGDLVPHLAEQIIFQGKQLVLRAQDHILQLL